VGVGTIDQNGQCGIAIWGDDESTDMIDGLKDGEAFELRMWDAENRQEIKLSPTVFLSGDGLTFQTDGLIVVDVKAVTPVPMDYFLSGGYPNPFNSVTRLNYGLPESGLVSISVYDITGRLVESLMDINQVAGYHNVTWDAGLASSGLYIVKLKTEEFEGIRKLILVK